MRTDRNMSRLNNKQRKKVILTAVTAGAILVGGIGLYREKKANDSMRITQNEGYEKKDTSEVLWNGKPYVYNNHLDNYLFLGIDQEEMADVKVGSAMAGQSDALFVVSYDRVKHTLTKISIPRDTMTDIEAFDAEGESLGKTKDHISLAYGYGDGKIKSCELSRNAVSNLFYGVPIYGYCAISLDSLPRIAESVGGLEVTIPNDSLEEVDESYKQGSTLHLDKNNTELFVRYRNTDISQSAIARLERQEAFLKAFGQKAEETYRENPKFITELYSDLKPYMVTNMGADQFSDIMDSVSGEVSNSWTVPGEGVAGEYYDEYHVDDSALYEKIIETFYEEKKE